tara:strand:- start:1165 stop:1971 length:807 start_codon:yes stop_codon:yes gene_type:complete
MKIFDCFQYFNEEHIADLRFNILNDFVDFFVIVESTLNHQGETKKLNFDINNYPKFKKKIIYHVVDDTPKNLIKSHKGGESPVEQFQRNSIEKGLYGCHDNDLVILSDVDEIPNLKKLDLFDKKNYAVFSQKMFMYKLNLLNLNENNWHGSRICLRKNLKSPQWLRNLKFKKYPFWRFDKLRNLQIIPDGGWHFAYLQNPKNIEKKIKSFAHGEYNTKDIADVNKIELKIKNNEDIFNRGYKIKKVHIDNNFPEFIVENKDKLKTWIV